MKEHDRLLKKGKSVLSHPVSWLVILFILSNLLNKVFPFFHNFTSLIRINTVLIFLLYLRIPTRKWELVFLFQILVTFFLSRFDSFLAASVETMAEAMNSLVSAGIFLFLQRKKSTEPYSRSVLILTVSAMIGAVTGGLLAHYGSKYFVSGFFQKSAWMNWIISSIIGMILISPVMIWQQQVGLPKLHLNRRKFWEFIILIFITILITYLIFTNQFESINLAINFPYLILPFVFWAAIRFHPAILFFLLVSVTLVIIRYLLSGVSFFQQAGQLPFQTIISLQVFILFTLECSYIMAGLFLSYQETQSKNHKLNDDLEMRVTLRTFELQQAVEALIQSEKEFREAFDTAVHGIALIDLEGNFMRVNAAFCDMIGYSARDLLKSNLREITYRPDFLDEAKMLKKLTSGKLNFFQSEKRLLHRDKMQVWVIESNSLITTTSGMPSHLVSQIINITERKQSEQQLRKYSETLTVLLREVNHRVKNNLSALISILHMEENKAESNGKREYIQILRNLISRIEGLSMVHSMLSASNWRPLDIEQLCKQIIHSVIRGLPSIQRVHLNIQSEELSINSNQSHHLAMILNELATNTVKYGLPDQKDGLIEVFIRQVENKFHIIYQDNGPGFPQELLDGKPGYTSTGFELIKGIITQSLDGSYSTCNQNGARIEMLFANEMLYL